MHYLTIEFRFDLSYRLSQDGTMKSATPETIQKVPRLANLWAKVPATLAVVAPALQTAATMGHTYLACPPSPPKLQAALYRMQLNLAPKCGCGRCLPPRSRVRGRRRRQQQLLQRGNCRIQKRPCIGLRICQCWFPWRFSLRGPRAQFRLLASRPIPPYLHRAATFSISFSPSSPTLTAPSVIACFSLRSFCVSGRSPAPLAHRSEAELLARHAAAAASMGGAAEAAGLEELVHS
jgi:hypothetical protein